MGKKITLEQLTDDILDRSNHTGTQLLSTISDFDASDYATAAQGLLADNSVQLTGETNQTIDSNLNINGDLDLISTTNTSMIFNTTSVFSGKDYESSLFTINGSTYIRTRNLTDNITGNVLIDQNGNMRPFTDSSQNLGNINTRWLNVYADNFVGDGSQLTGKIAEDDYATSTVGGTVKMRVDGTDLYITNDGTDA